MEGLIEYTSKVDCIKAMLREEYFQRLHMIINMQAQCISGLQISERIGYRWQYQQRAEKIQVKASTVIIFRVSVHMFLVHDSTYELLI